MGNLYRICVLRENGNEKNFYRKTEDQAVQFSKWCVTDPDFAYDCWSPVVSATVFKMEVYEYTKEINKELAS